MHIDEIASSLQILVKKSNFKTYKGVALKDLKVGEKYRIHNPYLFKYYPTYGANYFSWRIRYRSMDLFYVGPMVNFIKLSNNFNLPDSIFSNKKIEPFNSLEELVVHYSNKTYIYNAANILLETKIDDIYNS